jgi:cytoskeletal protein CcmA (bactofilin family)
MGDAGSPRTVQCYHCRQLFDVPPRAISISCPWCYRRVGLDDMDIRGVCWTSKIQTCGRIIIHPKASLVAPLVEASQGIEVHGSAEGILVSGSQIYIGPKARVKGEVRAPAMRVDKGGAIDGAFVQIAAARIDPAKPKAGLIRVGTNAAYRPVIRVPDWVRALRPT